MRLPSFHLYWDEIEYFDLAVAQAAKVPGINDVVDGCNGFCCG